jgi:putative ABC transport system ATP-binding protein
VEMSVEIQENWGNKREQATRILTQLGLGERINYKPHHLSGGQKQRVAIARALVNHPQLILADEPTAALDKVTSREVVDLLKKLAREKGCTVLMVTHDNRILDVADRMINLVDGRLESDQQMSSFTALQHPVGLDRQMFML